MMNLQISMAMEIYACQHKKKYYNMTPHESPFIIEFLSLVSFYKDDMTSTELNETIRLNYKTFNSFPLTLKDIKPHVK